MSSILEALRELEADRPPKAVHGVPVAPAPSEAFPRGRGVPLALAGGLAAGVLVAAVYLWSSAPDAAPPSSPAVTPGRAAAAAAPSQGRPAWLDGAEAPMARVTSNAPPSEVPVPSREVAPAPALPAAPPDVKPQRSATADVGSFQVESVDYNVPAARRSVTLRLNGDRVTLREGESADGVSVQLITPDGAYLQRGSEVFLATPPR